MNFLGIDTSNYTTSAALAENGEILCNSKHPVYVKPGERGARQSDAVFSHVKNLPDVVSRLGHRAYSAVGVSVRPRDVEGSYMPCFLAGQAVASSIATTLGVPLYTFSHQAGHVRAALYSAGRNDLIDKTFLAFHVSGGTTEVLLYEGGTITCVGGTLDINAGQLIDRVGVLLGLSFPCGKELDALCDFDALKRNVDIAPMANVKALSCNLSGLENKASDFLKKGVPSEVVAAFVIASVEKTLAKLTENALDAFADKVKGAPVIFSGGVSGNSYIQKQIGNQFNALFAERAFSSDNAAGIALLCEERYYAEHDG
ncbi:MAG: hypothetical protein IKM52_04475 [Clostridia bacterium]|nr:hypothetical protein [Clostridia bacterium]